MIVLRQKSYATAVHLGDGTIGIGANSTLPTAKDSAFLSLPKMADTTSKSGTEELMNVVKAESQKNKAGRIDAMRDLGGKEFYQKGTLTAKQAHTAGFNQGLNSATINKNTMMNTWRNMGVGGKVGTAAAGLAIGGLTIAGAKSLIDKRKKEQ